MFSVLLHPDVVKFLDRLSEEDRKRCVNALRMLKTDPFKPRPGVDIKKLKRKDKALYRLRVGDYRFEYFVEGNTVYVVEAFKIGNELYRHIRPISSFVFFANRCYGAETYNVAFVTFAKSKAL